MPNTAVVSTSRETYKIIPEAGLLIGSQWLGLGTTSPEDGIWMIADVHADGTIAVSDDSNLFDMTNGPGDFIMKAGQVVLAYCMAMTELVYKITEGEV